MNDFSIVLLRPKIPHNTVAIGRLFKIPMPNEHTRSINLANDVSIAAYECYRLACRIHPKANYCSGNKIVRIG